jgi:molybdopterin-guanine dinucleotide biosynthesis protein A
MAELLGDHAIAVPVVAGQAHPLSAVYRRGVTEAIARLLERRCLRVHALLDEVPVRRVSAAELRDVDPQLATLRNLNAPDDYGRALSDAGFRQG